jgi:hypothetical protein
VWRRENGALERDVLSRLVKKGSVVSVREFRRSKAEGAKNPQAYPLRYVEDFFGTSNEAAVKLSKRGTGNFFHHPAG